MRILCQPGAGDAQSPNTFNPEGLLNGANGGDISDLGPLGDVERTFLNFAVREYLVKAGYKLTAITFCDEVHCN